jgi:hypothetical protein
LINLTMLRETWKSGGKIVSRATVRPKIALKISM